LVNAAILVLAATVFYNSGKTDVASIKEAYRLLPMLGTQLAPKLFAIALIASGQSSTLTGTLAGQIVMEGYLQLRINPWVRRLLTRLLAIIPAVAVILISGEEQADNLLVLSQVVLSVQLGYAVIPLIHFVSDKSTMGAFTLRPLLRILSWGCAGLLIWLNGKLVIEETMPVFTAPGHLALKIGIVLVATAGLTLLGYIGLHPFIRARTGRRSPQLHPQSDILQDWTPPSFRQIAVALDFSEHDEKLLAYAAGQGGNTAQYLLIHVVESVSAAMLGRQSDDYETRKDQERLDRYSAMLREKGLQSRTALGYRNRSREIARIVREYQADMLVIGSHGHAGLKDLIYGETVNAVRHELKIPVLIVSL
jgi:manganese transport protein